MGMSVMVRTEGGPNCDIRMAFILTMTVSSFLLDGQGNEASLRVEIGGSFSAIAEGGVFEVVGFDFG